MIVMNWKWLSPLGPPGRRAALAAVLNLIPVILGGRTCHIADFLGLSLQFYYLVHHWLARLALLQTLVHAGIYIRQQERWTVQSGMGLAAMLLFMLITCSSIFYIRKRHEVMFVWCHKALAYLSLSFLLAHLWLVPLDRHIAGIEPDTEQMAGGINLKASTKIDTGAYRVKFRLPTDIRIYPGAYFYIFYNQKSFWRRQLGVPMMVYTWSMPDQTYWSDGKSLVSELTFLVEDRPSLAPLFLGTSITIDGPYGRDLRLDEYDHVFLLAEGIGISAVIPFAFALASRRQHDRLQKQSAHGSEARTANRQLHLDKTRRVTLIWAMNEGSQLEWAREEINRLMDLDPKCALLHIVVYHPALDDPTKPSLNNVQRELESSNKFLRHCKLIGVPENRWGERMNFQMKESMETSPGSIATADGQRYYPDEPPSNLS
ncbi:hypothetical protein CEP52_014849 [Fusarium oligoseptatum]|uniref:Uncharacterized protein n=1 Tax=Fusarium oligoseptatum TaxID=2604345 RepID=A0A428SIU2_9HYPO|nr:hypothetical protein CEP52_014849 [Fusarium oligoseptatum]